MARKGGFRHLVYFIDGTWLWAGSDNSLDVYSNIYRMNTLLNPDDADGRAQIVHYSRGLGANAGLKQYTAGAFASGIDELIADLYVNVCSNYEKGDKLYIFGFSRGAVVARALTGLLSYGILKDRHINMFRHVWASYTGQSGEVLLPGQPKISAGNPPIGDYIDSCSDRHPPIEFVGVFDTVSGGNGIAELAQRLRLAARRVQPNVRHAVQLLAIDETRSFFKPVLWSGTADPKAKPRPARDATFEQIWMPGVHSDVGGAYRSRSLGNLALLTMIDRVMAKTSLRFNLSACKKLQVFSGDDPILIHDEVRGIWKQSMLGGNKAAMRTIEPPLQFQSIHPLVKHLRKTLVNYKDKEKLVRYPLDDQWTALSDAPEFISENFGSNWPRLRSRSRDPVSAK